MAAVLDQIDADSRVFSHEVANPHSQMYVDLGRILLDILRQLLQNDVVIINTLDEYEVPGRDFLLAHNIPRLSLRTLAYFPDIIRYFIASRGSKEGQELYKQIFKHLYDYVREHLATIVSDPPVLLAFQKLIGKELRDLIKALRASSLADLQIFWYASSLTQVLQLLQPLPMSVTLPVEWDKLVSAMQNKSPSSGYSFSLPAIMKSLLETPTGHSSTATYIPGFVVTALASPSHPHDQFPAWFEPTAFDGPCIPQSPESYGFDPEAQLDPSHSPLYPDEEAETPGTGTEPSRTGSETGSVHEATGTDKSAEEALEAHTATGNTPRKLSDSISNV
ncbi:hypothetical protein CPB85DRAFT_1436460 [Mucidula mucida]|nr:hypothetical protein CPB85DRAFT_1436460 [Mucidula mucida]